MSTLSTIDAASILQRFLQVGGRRKSADTVTEALPHFTESLSQDDVLNALETLKVSYSTVRCRERELTQQECPALVFPNRGGCYLALERLGADLRTSDSQNPDLRFYHPGGGKCLAVRLDPVSRKVAEGHSTSVQTAFRDLGPMMPSLLFASLLINTLGLLTPLLIMAIYDRVIPSGSGSLLISLAFGVFVVGVSDFCFRLARSKALAYVGWRGEQQLMVALFRKLMSLPLAQLQKSGVHQQLARFRQFEGVRDVFTGQLMTTLLDLPFVLISLALLLYLAPTVGLLCMFIIIGFVVLGLITIPRQQSLDRNAAELAEVLRTKVQDAVRHQHVISNLGLQARWMEASIPLVDAAEDASRQARQFQTLTQSLAQSMVALTTVGAIVMSALGAVNGTLSFGALIASIALVSKVLAPLQSLYSACPQLLAFSKTQAQVDRVLSLEEELELGPDHSHEKTLRGGVTFSGVTYRPDPLNAALLSQASFNFEPGEIVLIMSSDVASRTAVLELIDGLHAPLAGTIEHYGIDIRQIATDELRKSTTYAPYHPSLLYGTIAQNFRLASLSLTDEEIYSKLAFMKLLNEPGLLQDGLDTRLTDRLLAGLSDETIKSLALARSMARESSLYLFSEPTNGLTDLRRAQFKDWVRAQHGQKTVVVATADRSFMQIADRFVFLNGDRVVVNATGEAGRRKLQAVLKTLEGQS